MQISKIGNWLTLALWLINSTCPVQSSRCFKVFCVCGCSQWWWCRGRGLFLGHDYVCFKYLFILCCFIFARHSLWLSFLQAVSFSLFTIIFPLFVCLLNSDSLACYPLFALSIAASFFTDDDHRLLFSCGSWCKSAARVGLLCMMCSSLWRFDECYITFIHVLLFNILPLPVVLLDVALENVWTMTLFQQQTERFAAHQ